jgi:hypothetical protein
VNPENDRSARPSSADRSGRVIDARQTGHVVHAGKGVGRLDLECVMLSVTLWIVRPRTMLSEMGAVMLVLVLWPPRSGNTLSD